GGENSRRLRGRRCHSEGHRSCMTAPLTLTAEKSGPMAWWHEADARARRAFGVIADRIGRKRALMAAVLIFSIFTAACGFAQTALQLAVFRILLGLGMGGEWATGAALVSESFPARHRGKALAFVQSAWAIGYGLAALVNMIAMPLWGWRGVFFVGVLPALFTLWIRRGVEEPVLWASVAPAERGRFGMLFEPRIRTVTIAIAL